MSALWGLVALRRFAAMHPKLEIPQAIDALRRLSADDAHHDYCSAMTLYECVANNSCGNDIVQLFQHTIFKVVERERPWWTRLAPLGRDRLRSALSPNEMQCFEAAGLFVEIPTNDVLAWWDRVAQTARASENDGNLQRGREAEKLSLAVERERLARFGIARDPRWIAIEDNAAGYDIQSFEPGAVEPICKLIEVKSCSGSLIRFFITSNEWETAIASAPHYQFHIWLMPDKKLVELSVSDVAPHIPANQGSGRWQNALVTLR
ncbi:MAG: DUF3883 domain-containing protein [Rhodocyclaceae bacterium]|nr:DUF3883 domain-containing protein [Rhodocyclaceae bacterium]